MWVQRASSVLAFLGLLSCAPGNVDIKNLALLGQETSAPPREQKAEIDRAVATFSNGRFTAGAGRWFILEAGMNPIAVSGFFDSGLRDSNIKAHRIIESGPDNSSAILYSWRIKNTNKGILAAVMDDPARKLPGLVAYYPIVISKGWNPALVASGNDG